MLYPTTILLIPLFDKRPNPNGLVKDVGAFVQALAKRYTVLVPIPEDQEQGFRLVLPDLVNVEYIPMSMYSGLFFEEMMTTREWYDNFNQFRGKYSYDAVLNLRHLNGKLLERIFTYTPDIPVYYKRIPIPVVHSPYAQVRVDEIRKYGDYTMCEDSEIEVWTYLSSVGTFLFHSAGEIDLVRRELLKVVRPTLIRDFLNKSVAMGGVDVAGFRKALSENPPHGDGIDVFTGGRMAGVKDHLWAAEVMHYLIASDGYTCNINSHSPKNAIAEEIIQTYPGVPLDLEQPYEVYLEKLNRSKVFLIASKKESFCYTMFEAFLAGNVVVFREAYWQKDLIPDWYPYVVKTKAEAIDTVRDILQRPSAADGYVRRMQEWIVQEFDIPMFEERLNSYMTGRMLEEYTPVMRKSGGLIELLQGLASPEDTVDDLKRKARKASGKADIKIPNALARLVIKWQRGDFN